MKCYRHLNLLVQSFIVLICVLHSNHSLAQTDEIKVNEYFFGTPLPEVFTTLVDKYKIPVEYDPQILKGFTFDHFVENATPDQVLGMITRQFPKFAYFKNEYEVYQFGIRADMFKETEIANTRFKGESIATNLRISGMVVDANSKESIPFATVGVSGTNNGTMTNEDGYFTLFNVPSDTSVIVASSVGFKNTRLFLHPDMDFKSLKLAIIPTSIDLNEVEVIAERDELMRVSDKVSVATMSPRKIAKLPNAGEKDIFRSFQLLPGISGSNEASSGLFVRGGTPDQNLILYDGFTVYHVDHLFGMFSAFNSNAVKEVELYKGGFESKYGGRISSVMNIVGKDGNEEKFNFGGDVGLLSVNGYIEIPLVKNKMTLFVAGRKSWQSPLYNTIFEKFSDAETTTTTTTSAGGPQGGGGGRPPGGVRREQAEPSSYFYDLNGKLSFKPSKKDILSLSFFNGADNIDNSRDFDGSGGGGSFGSTTDLTRWGNWGSSLNWSRKWNDVFYSYGLVSISNYFSERERTREATITNDDDEEEVYTLGTVEENQLYDYTAKWNGELKLSKRHQLEFGFQSTYYDINYDYTLNDTIAIQNRHDVGMQNSVYIQDHYSILNKMTFIPGLRVSHFDVTDEIYYEPRLSLSYKIKEKLKFSAAWGQYYQTAVRIIRNDLSSGSRDFWVLADDETVPVSSAQHYILGASYELPNYIFTAEAYYKNMAGLSEYSLQFTPSFDNVDFNELYFEGTGYSKGIEFMAQKKYGKYTGWAGYTLSETIYDFGVFGGQYYASQDVTHEIKLVQSYEIKNWTLSGTFIVATGKPYTNASGSYSVNLLDGSTQEFINLDQKNASRYPTYHRLDVAASRDFKIGEESKGSISLSVFNLYNRKNIWYKEFAVDGSELIITDVTLLGFTPNLTLSFNLR